MSKRRARGDGSGYFDVTNRLWIGAIDLPADAGGRRRRAKVSGRTKTQALINLRELRRRADAGDALGHERITVAQAVEDFLGRGLPAGLASNTRYVLGLYAGRFAASCGGRRLLALTTRDVEDFLRTLAGEGKARRTLVTARAAAARVLELVAANPDRLTYTDDLPGAAAAAGRQLQSAARTIADAGTELLGGRLNHTDADACAPTVLLLAPHPDADTTGLDGLLASVTAQTSRTGVALVVIGTPEHGEPTGWTAHVNEHGNLSLPQLGVELTAERLPEPEAAQLAKMLAVAAVAEDQPTPAARTEAPWDTYADACGALTVAVAAPASPAGGEPPDSQDTPPAAGPDDDAGTGHAPSSADTTVDSVLPLPAQTYLDRAATTQADLLALAPTVNGHLAGQVRRCDPDLDADLADWDDPACPRPRIGVLGPVQVRAQGSLPERSPQEAFHAEAVACLATRPHGLPVAVYAALMWPADPHVVGKTKVRQSITSLRKWLGREPDTGQEYLPAAAHDGGGVARYRIDGALIDAELFRRLRLRGQSRGPDGLPDLCRALQLVRGRPFTDIPAPREGAPGGYGWLTESNSRLDHEYAAMIVDTAHTVAVAQLGAGRPQQATQAAQVALATGSYEDVPLLDLVAASLAQDRPAEAEAYVAQILSNHDADVEEDLPPRTAQVLTRLRRRWVDQAS